ncbi:unnamed protein product [Cunninghamella echinulata]
MTLTNLENTLIFTPGSLYSGVGILLLNETKNQDKYDLKPVKLIGQDADNTTPEFIKLNKLGLVPILIDGKDQVIPDSLAIAQFLDVDDRLKSHDNKVIEQIDKWRQFSFRFLTLAEDIKLNLSPNNSNTNQLKESLDQGRKQLEQYAKEHPDVSYEERLTLHDTRSKKFLDSDFLNQHLTSWFDHLDYVNRLLEQQTHLIGNDYTLADLYASVFLFVAQRRLYTNLFENRPHLESYFQRQLKRPSFIQSFFKY